MNEYEQIRSVANDKVLIGNALSFPLPVMHDGKIADVFFVFSVSKQTKIPNKPSAALYVTGDDVVQVAATEVFADIEFAPSAFESKPEARKIAKRIAEIYADVRNEVASGTLGEASREYTELIIAITQSCLMPYYEELAPSLFDDFKNEGR